MNRIGLRVPRMWAVCTVIGVLTIAFGMAGSAELAHAAGSEIGTTTVSFNIAEAIEVTSWPASSFTLSSAATPGTPVVSGTLNITVKSNSVWGIQVASEHASGMLREYDPNLGGYVSDGRTLGPIEWAPNVNGPWHTVSSTPTTMFTNQPPTGEAGATVGFVLRVVPTFDDEPLPPGREYRIVLTYTAGVGF